ncbi:MFS transporter [Streptomyces mangrovisoli]|uniref:MFS transporter n=1 Tax=Streptomyces mangrovisoli TaxID=1428628 RepID=A0A1J4P1B7_9ACTN|nr:MFS transporter [Streptomyces mangrovisoli]OIJ68535.1 MFS transporter [Streptomyces mangrovisoli]
MTGAAVESGRTAPDQDAPASVGAAVGLLVLFELTSGFLQTGVTPLLPALGERHGVGASALNWVISVQLLAGAVLVPVFGRLGDLHGHRRMLRLALTAVACGSLLVALAPDYPALLAGRALQGALVALLPLEIALVRDRLPAERARSAIARLVGALALGSLLGAVVMGALADAVGDIRLTLLVPAVAVALCVPVSFLFIPESVPKAAGRPDWPGALLLGLALVGLLSGVARLEDGSGLSTAVLLPVAAAAVLGAVWVWHELRSADPLVDLRAMRGRRVAPFYLTSFLFGVMYFGSQTPNSTFLAADPRTDGYGFALPALKVALVSLPAAVAAVITSSATAVIARRLGYRRTLMTAFALMAAGFAALACFHQAVWQVVAALVVCGTGIGVSLGALPTVIVEATDPARTGVASALYNNVKTTGGAVTGGVVAALLAAFTTGPGGAPAERGYVVVWALCALAGAAAVGAVAVARRGEEG